MIINKPLGGGCFVQGSPATFVVISFSAVDRIRRSRVLHFSLGERLSVTARASSRNAEDECACLQGPRNVRDHNILHAAMILMLRRLISAQSSWDLMK